MDEWPISKGGLTAQVSSFFPELWEHYGLTPLTVWDVEVPHFFAIASAIDENRSKQKKEDRKAARKGGKR
jgi:hypothetical protein